MLFFIAKSSIKAMSTNFWVTFKALDIIKKKEYSEKIIFGHYSEERITEKENFLPSKKRSSVAES